MVDQCPATACVRFLLLVGLFCYALLVPSVSDISFFTASLLFKCCFVASKRRLPRKFACSVLSINCVLLNLYETLDLVLEPQQSFLFQIVLSSPGCKIRGKTLISSRFLSGDTVISASAVPHRRLHKARLSQKQ